VGEQVVEEGTGPGAAGPGVSEFPVLDEAGQQLRAPWAASLAGLLFAALFTVAIVLIRNSPLSTDSQAALDAAFAGGRDLGLFLGTVYLVPFAGILFLWFIAVIRDQLGDREDRFFGTVFFGSGLLFVALVFAATAVAAAPSVGVRYLDQPAPSLEQLQMARSIAYTLLYVIATRAAAVFLISISTLGVRSGVFPRWFAATGYLFGLTLLLFVSFWDLYVLSLPVWVAGVSVFILRRERDRVRQARGAAGPSGPAG